MTIESLVDIDFLPSQATNTENRFLPARMKPLPDELFSSWLTRLAMAHCLKLHTFTRFVFGKIEIWNRDIDKSASAQHIMRLREVTGYSEEDIFKTTLHAYEGRLYEFHNPNGNSAWIMPAGVFRRTRKNFGLQICPICLKEDSEPYYRRAWRLSVITVCVKHKIVLLDRCPNCQSPVIFHRGEMGIKSLTVFESITECPQCHSDWTSENVISVTEAAIDSAVKFQTKLQEILQSGFGEIRNYGSVHSILYFNGLKQILKLLSISTRSQRFRRAVSFKSDLPPPICQPRRHSFDHLPVNDRYRAVCLAAWLLAGWSKRIIEIAIETKTWSSALLADFNDAPFWYWSIVHDFLTRTSYCLSPEEIRSALKYLERREQIILPVHLKRVFSKVDLLRKKDEEFKNEIYKSMKKNNQKFQVLHK